MLEPARENATVANNRPAKHEQKGHRCEANVPRMRENWRQTDGQRLWEAKDPEVANRLQVATEFSG